MKSQDREEMFEKTGSRCRSASSRAALILACCAIVLSAFPQTAQANHETAEAYRLRLQEYLDNLRKSDTCGALYTSKSHGYDVREYDIVTKDNYKLKLHRLVHPEDYLAARNKPHQHDDALKTKKPYLLVHGLIGTSASFLLNIDDNYRAPLRAFQARRNMVNFLKSKANVFHHDWEATSQRLQAEHDQQKRDKWAKQDKIFADLNELVYDGDELNFAPEFRQAYRKFPLPSEALPFTTNSLAMTLSNFGYDVWMINLRGNDYSKGYNGPLSAGNTEYWDFGIETLVREDLMAAINFITLKKENKDDPIGLVTYSYSGAYVMNLLAAFPAYVERLQPIVMLAPTLLTDARDRASKSKYALKLIDKLLSKNGPFPTLGRTQKEGAKRHHLSSLLSLSKLDANLAKLICSLPVASQLCHFMEAIIHGGSRRVSTVRGLVLGNDRSTSLMQRDNDCGQTSKAILHQIFKNIDQENIMPEFKPFDSVAKRRQLRQSNPSKVVDAKRRSVILIHSQDDEVATPSEVERIRSTALKTMTLLDYVIKSPEFGHADFLFSHRNQYLVNAEVARQVLLFDFMAYQSYANRPSEVPQGIQ